MRRKYVVLLVITSLLSAACSAKIAPSPVPSITLAPTITLVPSTTASPPPSETIPSVAQGRTSATATPDSTPTPSNTASPTPSQPPTSSNTPTPTSSQTPTLPPTPTETTTSTPVLPSAPPTPTPAPIPPSQTPIPIPPSETPVPVPPSETPVPVPPSETPVPPPTLPPPPPTQPPQLFPPPPGRQFASLEDFWNGNAEWVLEVPDTGLPVGESDTIYRGGTEFWSYLHASQPSAGVVDQCGDPVPFPGCTTLWKSYDGGQHFQLENPVCLFPCAACPCEHGRDHIGQQQYPRISFTADGAYLVYEFGAYVYLRTSADGVNWSGPSHVPGTGIWHFDHAGCNEFEAIGEHPHIYSELEWDCLVGGPPGIYTEGNLLYVFVALGRAPGHMGCLVGNRYNGAWGMRKCTSNPLFGADLGYGPPELLGVDANPYFEFRTISSADVVRVGGHYYMVYEGVRGPSNPTVVDDQFGLGLARSVGPAVDGAWEKYPGNPIIMPLPGNVGVGHADLVVAGNATYLYTATPAYVRGRYVLVRR